MLRKTDCARWTGTSELPADPEFEKTFPTLHAFLTQRKWEDGSRRELGSLAVYPGDGIIRVLLRDPNFGTQAWVAVDRLSKVLVAADAAIADLSYDWRLDREHREKQKGQHDSPPVNGKVLDKRKGRR